MATLDTEVKKLEDNKVEVKVTVPVEEVAKSIATAYKNAGKVRIPGFRPGKAPRRVLENHYGGKEYFLAEATEEIVNIWFPRALDAEDLIPLKKAEFSLDETVQEGEAYTFIGTVIVKPELELSSYEPVQVELPSDKVSDEEIDQQVESLREYYVTYDEVEGRAACEGDTVILDLETTLKGEPVEGLTVSGQPYEVGSKAMPDEFDGNIVGMQVGEEKEFDFGFDEDLPEAEGENERMHVKATVTNIRTKVLPEVTDAWVKATLDYEGVEDLREKISDSIQVQKSQQMPDLKDVVCQNELVSRLVGEPSEEMVRNAEQSIYRDFFDMLQKRSMTFDQYLMNNDISPEKFQKDTQAQAKESSAASLALDALARNLGLAVSEEEIIAEFERSGIADSQKLYSEWKANGRLPEIREGLLRMKAARHLNDTAEVFDIGAKPEPKKAKKSKVKADNSKAEDVKADSKKAEDKKPAVKKPRAKKAKAEAKDEAQE
ncbi:MAG: trigger factor [Coriobacteriaceae bacterium]|nr:trigger factor [Coriobacteriaceae bacterium]